MNKYVAGLFVAVVASIIGFVIHVASQEWIGRWVTSFMQGRDVTASWDVRYVAAATSLETGAGMVILYLLVRRALPERSTFFRGIVLGVLLLAVMGRLFRQPFMNVVIGNPLQVVAVQDGIVWLIYVSMSLVVAIGCDVLISKESLRHETSAEFLNERSTRRSRP